MGDLRHPRSKWDRQDDDHPRARRPFFLLIPVMASSVIAFDSFPGEKERITIEALLATPLTDEELLFGKMLASFVPAMAVTILFIIAYTVVVDRCPYPGASRDIGAYRDPSSSRSNYLQVLGVDVQKGESPDPLEVGGFKYESRGRFSHLSSWWESSTALMMSCTRAF